MIVAFQRMEQLRREGDDLTAYFSGDIVYQSALAFAPFPVLQESLLRWDTVPADEPCCWTLVNPRRPVPQIAVTDAKCPTLRVLDELRAREWRHEQRGVVHERSDGGGMRWSTTGGMSTAKSATYNAS